MEVIMMAKLPTKLDKAKKELPNKTFEIIIEEVEINPKILGDEIYMQIPSGYSFKSEGITFVINHNIRETNVKRVKVI